MARLALHPEEPKRRVLDHGSAVKFDRLLSQSVSLFSKNKASAFTPAGRLQERFYTSD